MTTYVVTAHSEPDGRLRIDWSEDIGAADVFVTTEPERWHSEPIAKQTRAPVIVERRDARKRHYFQIRNQNGQVLETTERALPLDHGTNFRDFGGYATQEGRRVRWGVLYRSGHMAKLTDEDIAVLASLDIRVNCDFRRRDEIESHPSRLPDGVKVVPLSIDSGSATVFYEFMRSGHASVDELVEFMRQINRNFVVNQQHVYCQVLDTLLELEEGAMLINCAAGKDRTGFGAAVILMALGVSRDEILDDYLLSQRYYPIEREMPRVMRKYGPESDGNVHSEWIRPMMEARPEYLSNAFAAIDEEFGDDAIYLEQALGLTDDKRELLRKRFTVEF